MGWKDEFKWKNFGLSYNQPIKFAQSQWPGVHPVFLGWRSFWALWHLAWLIVSIIEHGSDDDANDDRALWLIYLTNWSYLVLAVQSWAHLAVVVYHIANGHKDPGQFPESTRWYDKAVWVLTSTSFNAAILVTLLYWSLIFKKLNHPLNIVTHAVTSLYAISDMFISATPWRLAHFIYPFLYALIYIIFTIIFHLADGTNHRGEPYVYDALDWSKTGETTGLVFGVLIVAVPVAHLFLFALYKLRIFINDSCSCCQREKPTGSTNAVSDVELQI